MDQSQIETIVERWLEDEDFRQRLRAAPIETVEAEGYLLSEEERTALSQMDLSLSDEELAQRASFGT